MCLQKMKTKTLKQCNLANAHLEFGAVVWVVKVWVLILFVCVRAMLHSVAELFP